MITLHPTSYQACRVLCFLDEGHHARRSAHHIDLGKHSFHVHGQDLQGKALLRKRLSRKQLIVFLANSYPCTVVMEACTGARARHGTLTA